MFDDDFEDRGFIILQRKEKPPILKFAILLLLLILAIYLNSDL